MNINDYISANKNKTFKQLPFNEVDNLIFAELSYIDYRGVADQRLPITLSKAAEKLLQDNKRFKKQQYIRMLKLMAESKRYKNILLSDYIAINNQEKQEQFSAITIGFQPFRFYVAFRGTDEKLYSWKEDFNMTYLLPVPAQKRAEDYLKQQVKKHPLSIFVVGGHSKGGNLAVYSAVQLKQPKKISLVFNNDGPGFDSEFINSTSYQDLVDKMITFMPQSSIVGILLSSDIQKIIVYSDETNIMGQHNGFTWQLDGESFIRVNETTKESKFIEEAMNGWGDNLTNQQKSVFIDNVYEACISLNIKNFGEVKNNTGPILRELFERFKTFELEERKLFTHSAREMVKSFTNSFYSTYVKGRNN